MKMEKHGATYAKHKAKKVAKAAKEVVLKPGEVSRLSDAKVYEENPFVDVMMGELKIKRKKQMLKSSTNDTDVLLINSDGEVAGYSAFMREIQVDEDKFAKLYITQLAALWDLKKPSIKVLTFILSVMKVNDDKVYLDSVECCKFCGWSGTRQMYEGLLGLINASIIARTEKFYFYYINPSIVFNGSRVTFMTTYVKRRRAKELPNPNQTKLDYDSLSPLNNKTESPL